MINKNRIVPSARMDLLTLFGTILTIASVSYSAISASNVEGDFSVTGSGDVGTKLADQPLKSLDFVSGVTAGTVYFVADYEYTGMKIAGAAATPTGTVLADGATLHKAVLSSGTITITKVSPVAS